MRRNFDGTRVFLAVFAAVGWGFIALGIAVFAASFSGGILLAWSFSAPLFMVGIGIVTGATASRLLSFIAEGPPEVVAAAPRHVLRSGMGGPPSAMQPAAPLEPRAWPIGEIEDYNGHRLVGMDRKIFAVDKYHYSVAEARAYIDHLGSGAPQDA